MSDETPPPPLRLRPRQSPETGGPPAAAPDAAAGAEEGKLRLRPKLAGTVPDKAAPASVESAPDPGSPAVERVRLKPKLNVVPEEAAAPEALPTEREIEALAPPPAPEPEEGKIKLKIKLPGAAAAASAAPAGETEATIPPTVPPSPPPFSEVLPPPPEDEETGDGTVPPMLATVSPPPRVPPPPPTTGTSPPGLVKRPRLSPAMLAAEHRKRMWRYALVAVFGVLLAGAVIGGAYLKLAEPLPPPNLPTRANLLPAREPLVVTPPPAKPEAAPASSKMAVAKPGETGSAMRVDSTATVELTPGVLATTESVKAVPNASSAFRTFVANARISGVYQGTPQRAFINGRLVRSGEMIDSSLEIYFDGVDLANRSIIFKDSIGATVSRRY